MFLSKADAFTNPPPICVAVIKLLDEKLRYPPFINMDVTWMKCICGVVGTGLTMEVQQFVNLWMSTRWCRFMQFLYMINIFIIGPDVWCRPKVAKIASWIQIILITILKVTLPWVKTRIASSWQFVSSQVEFKLRSAFVGMFSSFELLERQPWVSHDIAKVPTVTGVAGFDSNRVSEILVVAMWIFPWDHELLEGAEAGVLEDRWFSWCTWHFELVLYWTILKSMLQCELHVQVIEDHCHTRVVRPHGVKGFKPADMGSHEVVAAIYQVGRLWRIGIWLGMRHWRVHTPYMYVSYPMLPIWSSHSSKSSSRGNVMSDVPFKFDLHLSAHSQRAFHPSFRKSRRENGAEKMVEAWAIFSRICRPFWAVNTYHIKFNDVNEVSFVKALIEPKTFLRCAGKSAPPPNKQTPLMLASQITTDRHPAPRYHVPAKYVFCAAWFALPQCFVMPCEVCLCLFHAGGCRHQPWQGHLWGPRVGASSQLFERADCCYSKK